MMNSVSMGRLRNMRASAVAVSETVLPVRTAVTIELVGAP
jgi:hypothetical protein